MRELDHHDVVSLRNVLAFTVLAHVADLITTHFRDPGLNFEGNPFYQLAEHVGFEGWPALVVTKVVFVGALGLGFWWYLRSRRDYLPDKVVASSRALIWYGMWDRRPYPRSMFGRLFNRGKLAFMALMLGGVALPGSGAAALFVSVDNVSFAVGRGMPFQVASELLLATVIAVCLWFGRAYWKYYTVQVEEGHITDKDAD
jgi:hypothetical protein